MGHTLISSNKRVSLRESAQKRVLLAFLYFRHTILIPQCSEQLTSSPMHLRLIMFLKKANKHLVCHMIKIQTEVLWQLGYKDTEFINEGRKIVNEVK